MPRRKESRPVDLRTFIFFLVFLEQCIWKGHFIHLSFDRLEMRPYCTCLLITQKRSERKLLNKTNNIRVHTAHILWVSRCVFFFQIHFFATYISLEHKKTANRTATPSRLHTWNINTGLFGVWAVFSRKQRDTLKHHSCTKKEKNDRRRIEKHTSAMNEPQTADNSTIRPGFFGGWYIFTERFFTESNAQTP